MSRTTQVRFEDVAQACSELFRAGESVSFAKVYQRIGSRGGQQVVTDMIRRWRQEIAQRVLAKREHPELPPVLVDASQVYVAQVDRENLEVKALLARVQGQLQARELAHEELGQRYQALQEKLAQTERERVLAREQAGQLEGALASDRQRHGDAIQALKAQHATQLHQVQVQADSDRKHLMVQ